MSQQIFDVFGDKRICLDAARIAEELKALDVQAEIASRDAGQEIAGILAALKDMKTHLAAASSDPERLRAFAKNHIRKISRLDDAKWEIVLNVTGESRFVYLEEWYTRRDSNARPSTPEADALSN